MTPIAMICSLEQFEDIKPILNENGLKIFDIDDFNTHPFLVNNYISCFGRVSNVFITDKHKHNRTVFEEWNKDIFLEYCNIKPLKLLKRNT